MIFITWLVHCLLLILSVAFYTLFERKVIGLSQLRVGPNKVSFTNLVQPLLDAFKLIMKQPVTPVRANNFIYSLSPIIALFLAIVVWATMPTYYMILSINYSLVLFFCLGSIIVFSVLIAGWSSNSKYRLIGRLRSIAQSISYESVFRTLIVILMIFIASYSIRSLFTQSSAIFLVFFPVWLICTLAETHRAPFDFAESESELVSGFNTEYSGIYFAFCFLSEYIILLYSCFLWTYIFFMWLLPNNLIAIFAVSIFFTFLFIWIRVTYCRFRYDILMIISWKILLPMTLCLFMAFIPLVL